MELHPPDDEDSPKTLECTFCKARLYFWAKDPTPKKYHSHLRNQHEIIYQIDLVVQATFEQQYPELVPQSKKDCKCEKLKGSKDKNVTSQEEHLELLDEDYDSDLEILSDSEAVFNKPQATPAQKPGPKSRRRNSSAASDDSTSSAPNRNNRIEIKDEKGRSVYLAKFPSQIPNQSRAGSNES